MLVGHVYIQDADPGVPPLGGYEWVKPTTGDVYIRNGANSAWVLKGNVNQPNLGNLTTAGGAVTGPITGGHGLAGLNSPDFQTAAKKAGKNLALMTDVNAMAATLRSEFSSVAAALVAGAMTTSATKANVAMKMGVSGQTTSTTYWEIPLPQYPDLTVAKEADCVWIPSVKQTNWFDDTVVSGTQGVYLEQHPTQPRQYRCWGLDTTPYPGYFYYLIIGVR